MKPRKAGSTRSPTVSVGEERGLANWPAMRPSFTTGTPEPYVNTTAICRMTFSLSLIESAEKPSKDSAQSPACSRKARPSATSPNAAVNRRASPANTSGGRAARRLRTSSTRPSSGHSGCWLTGRARQVLGVQEAVTPYSLRNCRGGHERKDAEGDLGGQGDHRARAVDALHLEDAVDDLLEVLVGAGHDPAVQIAGPGGGVGLEH